VAPCALMIATDSPTDVPAEMTSSTMTTRPASGAPMTVPPSPWSLASLRLKAKGRLRPCAASATAIDDARAMPLYAGP